MKGVEVLTTFIVIINLQQMSSHLLIHPKLTLLYVNNISLKLRGGKKTFYTYTYTLVFLFWKVTVLEGKGWGLVFQE